MTTAIPPTEYDRILQTNSSPETIAALLNEAERTYSGTPKHWTRRYTYPFWKICEVCSQPFQCHDRSQVRRKKTCSSDCLKAMQSAARKGRGKPPEERPGMVQVSCAVCGALVWRYRSHVKRHAQQFCSSQCNGVVRGQEWAKHAHKGRAAWTDESHASYREKMTGERNPAWKGGVTYFKTHGNYTGVRYVRCPEAYRVMARKDGYVMEHRLLVAQAIGRPLLRSEVVHHKDHDPANNSLDNLQLFASNRNHKLYEHHGSPDPIWQL